MKSSPGAAITFKPSGCGETEILSSFIETSVCIFSGGNQCVTAAAPHAGMFHNPPQAHWGDGNSSELGPSFCFSTIFLFMSQNNIVYSGR